MIGREHVVHEASEWVEIKMDVILCFNVNVCLHITQRKTPVIIMGVDETNGVLGNYTNIPALLITRTYPISNCHCLQNTVVGDYTNIPAQRQWLAHRMVLGNTL